MNNPAEIFIYLDSLAFILLGGLFLFLFKSNKWFQKSKDSQPNDE